MQMTIYDIFYKMIDIGLMNLVCMWIQILCFISSYYQIMKLFNLSNVMVDLCKNPV